MLAKDRAYGVRHGVYVHCFNQPERDYSVRHGVYVRCFNQSERDYSVRHGAYVGCFNQPERGYSVRHGVYVTACVRNALCTPLCTSLHTPLHIPAHPSAHPFVHTPLHTPLHIPLCTPLRTYLHTPKNPARSVPILLLMIEVIHGAMTGRQSLITRIVILSIPGALLSGIDLTTYPTREDSTGSKENCSDSG